MKSRLFYLVDLAHQCEFNVHFFSYQKSGMKNAVLVRTRKSAANGIQTITRVDRLCKKWPYYRGQFDRLTGLQQNLSPVYIGLPPQWFTSMTCRTGCRRRHRLYKCPQDPAGRPSEMANRSEWDKLTFSLLLCPVVARARSNGEPSYRRFCRG